MKTNRDYRSRKNKASEALLRNVATRRVSHGGAPLLSTIAMSLAILPQPTLAGAVTDSSWGRTPQTLAGNFVIPESAGKLAGTNLFHSFQSFSIGIGESAKFTTTTSTLQNVISRVSGATPSVINGPLSLVARDGSAPNFFFINPNGVTFGAGAQINVPASFHLSTASSLKFGDGTLFTAGNGPDNTFSVAAPEAFGFLGRNGNVAFKGVQADGAAGHAAFTASSLDVSAVEIRLDDSQISIPTANVRLVAMGSTANSVPLTENPAIGTDGSISLTNSRLKTSGTPTRSAGAIGMMASTVQLENSVLQASHTGTRLAYAGLISIEANNVLVLGKSGILANGSDGGGSGSIAIRASGEVSLAPMPGTTEGPLLSISALVQNPQQTGEILIEGGSVSLVNAAMSTQNADVKSRPISIISRSNLSLSRSELSTGRFGSGGASGPINLDARGGDISIADSVLESDSRTGLDPGGPIRVSATGKVTLSKAQLLSRGYGNVGGPIEILGTEISLKQGSTVSATQDELPPSVPLEGHRVGSIKLTASDGVSIDESSIVEARNLVTRAVGPDRILPNEIRVIAPKLVLRGTISTETKNLPASAIVIESRDATGQLRPLAISGDGTGILTSSTNGIGNAGPVTLRASQIGVSGMKLVSQANANSRGRAGTIELLANQGISIANSRVATDTSGAGAAGSIHVSAKGLIVDSSEISSVAHPSAQGSAGTIGVRVADAINVTRGSRITSRTESAVGRAGSVSIDAATISVDGGSSINAAATAGSSGQTGSVLVSATDMIAVSDRGSLSIKNDGSNGGVGGMPTSLSVTAPTIRVSGGTITAETSGNGTAGDVTLAGVKAIQLQNGANVSSSSSGSGKAGSVVVNAGSLTMDKASIQSQTLSTISGQAGTVKVNASDAMTMANGSLISTDAAGMGNAGSVSIAARSLATNASEVSSVAHAGARGNAGTISVKVRERIDVVDGSTITSRTESANGHAGSVTIDASTINVAGRGGGINAEAAAGSSGQTGSVRVSATDLVKVSDGASLSIRNDGTAANPTGIAPTSLNVTAPSILVSGGTITAEASGNVSAGDVSLTGLKDIQLRNGADVSSSSSGSGKAGSVFVNAGTLAMDDASIQSQALSALSGQAGRVDVTAADAITMLNGSLISTDASGIGDAGSVSIRARSLMVDPSEISSVARDGARGNAGAIDIKVTDKIDVVDGSTITSRTESAVGRAGSVNVDAATINVAGLGTSINAAASAGSSGQTGSVTVLAAEALNVSNGANLNITNDATVANPASIVPTTLSVSAPTITVDGAQLTSASKGNVAASNISLAARDTLNLIDAGVTTTAQDGNGGAIAINGGQMFWLTNSRILTSVAGLAGNGGNINVNGDTLIMQTGFIQANTAASDASGGNISINVSRLIPSGSTVLLGGATPRAFQSGLIGFNVIQAAAPDGVAGTIQITSPQLDLTGSLTNLSAAIVDTSALSRDLCRIGAGSSLTPIGRGGLAPSALDALRPEGPLTPASRDSRASAPSTATPPLALPLSPIALGCF